MTSFANLKVAAVVEHWPAVVPVDCVVRERCEHIDFGQCHCGSANPTGLRGHGHAQLGENTALNFNDLLLRVENL